MLKCGQCNNVESQKFRNGPTPSKLLKFTFYMNLISYIKYCLVRNNFISSVTRLFSNNKLGSTNIAPYWRWLFFPSNYNTQLLLILLLFAFLQFFKLHQMAPSVEMGGDAVVKWILAREF